MVWITRSPSLTLTTRFAAGTITADETKGFWGCSSSINLRILSRALVGIVTRGRFRWLRMRGYGIWSPFLADHRGIHDPRIWAVSNWRDVSDWCKPCHGP